MLFCALHKMKHHTELKNSRCEHIEGCALRGLFHVNGTRMCGKHRRFSSDVLHITAGNGAAGGRWGRTCEVGGCNLTARYGPMQLREARRCSQHRIEGDVDVKRKRCQGGDGTCVTCPSFGSVAERVARFCSAHKPPDFVDVRSRRCDLCERRATWGVPGQSRLSRCGLHKQPFHSRRPLLQVPGSQHGMHTALSELPAHCDRQPDLPVVGIMRAQDQARSVAGFTAVPLPV